MVERRGTPPLHRCQTSCVTRWDLLLVSYHQLGLAFLFKQLRALGEE
jgi:hypothetical protein